MESHAQEFQRRNFSSPPVMQKVLRLALKIITLTCVLICSCNPPYARLNKRCKTPDRWNWLKWFLMLPNTFHRYLNLWGKMMWNWDQFDFENRNYNKFENRSLRAVKFACYGLFGSPDCPEICVVSRHHFLESCKMALHKLSTSKFRNIGKETVKTFL